MTPDISKEQADVMNAEKRAAELLAMEERPLQSRRQRLAVKAEKKRYIKKMKRQIAKNNMILPEPEIILSGGGGDDGHITDL